MDHPPTIEETYQLAVGARRLMLEEHRSGPADLLIAAGWSEHQTGMALLRLHSEYQGAAKPARLGPAQIATLAVQHRDKEGRPNRQKAVAEAARWYSNELRLLAISLKSRPTVWAQLLPWSQAKGIPQEQVAQALFHFLDPVCGHCGGHGHYKAKDAPALSAKQCRACNGTGTKAIPDGGGRVLSYISHCTSQARQSISKRLRPKE
jgi:hypothetical protein